MPASNGPRQRPGLGAPAEGGEGPSGRCQLPGREAEHQVVGQGVGREGPQWPQRPLKEAASVVFFKGREGKGALGRSVSFRRSVAAAHATLTMTRGLQSRSTAGRASWAATPSHSAVSFNPKAAKAHIALASSCGLARVNVLARIRQATPMAL